MEMEEQLRRTNTFLDSIIENIPDMIFIKDAKELRFVRFNRAGEELLGQSREGLLGKNDYDFFPLEQADHFVSIDRRVLQGKTVVDIPDEAIETSRKGRRILHTKKVPVLNEQGEPNYLLGISEDITERRQAEEDLRRAEERFRAIALNTPDHIIIQDRELRYVFVVNHQLGLTDEDMIGKTDRELTGIAADDTEKLTAVKMKVLETGNPYHFEASITNLEGKPEYFEGVYTPKFDVDGKVDGLIGYFRNVTERRQAEEEREKLQAQLAQVQKLESLGRLAGGVAHDFNNMLGVILGHVELAKEDTGPHELLRADLDEIEKAARRSADLTRQLLAFARKQTVAPKVVDLNQTVESMLAMLTRLIGEDIDLVWRPGCGIRPVFIDPAQVGQILVTVRNSRDALREWEPSPSRQATSPSARSHAPAVPGLSLVSSCCFPWPTTAAEWTPRPRATCSSPFSPPSRWARAPVWVWRPCTGWSRRTTASSTATRKWGGGPRSRCTCPVIMVPRRTLGPTCNRRLFQHHTARPSW